MTTTIDTALHTLLENVEEMKLPEGDYLMLTNLMKKVFDENKKNPSNVETIVPAHPIIVKLMKCMMKHIEIEVEITQAVKTTQANGMMRAILTYIVRTKNTKLDTFVVKQGEAFAVLRYDEKGKTIGDVLSILVDRYRPMSAEFTMDDITTEFTLESLKDHEMAEDAVLFDEDQREDMEYTYERLFSFCLLGQIKNNIQRWVTTR